MPWWQSSPPGSPEVETPAPDLSSKSRKAGGAEVSSTADEAEDEPTQDLEQLGVAPTHTEADAGGGFAVGPRELAAIVIIPILVFGVSLLAASYLMKPSVPPVQQLQDTGQKTAANGTAGAAPTGGVLAASSPTAPAAAAATPVPTPVPTPVSTPTPSATPSTPAGATPFQLVPSPVRAAGTFSQGAGGCRGFPAGFSDQFIFTTAGGTLTLKQMSTGDVTSGPVQTDGTFTVKAADGSETYTGRITGLTANANYQHTDKAGCRETYVLGFRFQV